MYPQITIEPKQDLLIYGAQYKLWRDGIYIGIATWTDDKNIGDAFTEEATDIKGRPCRFVFQADEWELIPKDNG